MTRPRLMLPLLALTSLAVGCDAPPGPPGPTGDTGEPGEPGEPGRDSYLTGPGLEVEVLDATIAMDGAAEATVRITDEDGIPLDRTGHFTAGAVDLRFILAYLPLDAAGDPAEYVAYTTRIQTTPGGVSAVQADGENTGSFEEIGVGDGTYRYTFATSIAVVDASLTHTVGVYGSRTVAGTRHGDDAVFHFVPAGATVTDRREIVDDNACAGCHDDLALHGGARKQVELCILCHTSQSSDPDTGNPVAMRVMIHKIHRGAELPSVQGGTPYQIIGFNQRVHDYSTVEFPQQLSRCEACHQATLGEYWKTKPSKAPCTACHDDISFSLPVPAGKVLHSGGTQGDNAPCAVCHAPTGSIAGITEKHLAPEFDPARPEPIVTILGIENTAPGDEPVVTFQVKVNTVDGPVPRDIIADPLTSLRFTFAGPNTDYATYWQVTAQASSGVTGQLDPVDAAQGVFSYTVAPAAEIPAGATGSYTVGIEAAIQATGGPRFGAVSPTLAFAVTDATAQPRRQVVDANLCNSCHYELNEHGGGRKNVQYCVMCHNPNNVNDERAPRFEDADVFVHSVDLKVMVHRIHMGEELSQEYVLGGFPTPNAGPTPGPGGTPIDFGETRYPSRRSNCASCHVGDTWYIPLPASRLPSREEIRTCLEDPAADGDALCEPDPGPPVVQNWVVLGQPLFTQPEAAACTGCHDASSVVAHAQVMTTVTGEESCATCHGEGSAYDVGRVHEMD